MEQIKSKERVKNFGEVYTAPREVNAMLDLVPLWKNPEHALRATFLEQACGNGNFLAEILSRKIQLLSKSRKPNYKKDQVEYEKALLVAVGTIYGIDILEDNKNSCVERLYKIAVNEYRRLFKKNFNENFERGLKFVISRNIVCGDALTMKDSFGEPIKFSEWKNPFNGYINRKEYAFEDLFEKGDKALPLSDTNVPYYIPREIKDYGNIEYRKVYEYEKQE